jgi:hypothetical protein
MIKESASEQDKSAEDDAIASSIAKDNDTFEWSDEDFKNAQPAETLNAEITNKEQQSKPGGD